MEFYGLKLPENGWLMPCKKRCSCRLNWQKLKRLSKTIRKLRRPVLRMTSCVHPLKRLCTPSCGIVLSFTCTRSTLLRGRFVSMGPDLLTERLDGLPWQWIPYAASGIPLAREIQKAVASRPETDVLILGNHGLVVCGPDCHAAEKLLGEVERRLAITPRGFPKPDTTVLAIIARFSRWQFPDVDLLHALGTDAASRKILRGGVLYPCQAIFLGPTMPLLPPAAVISKFTERWSGQDTTPVFVAVERSGVMLNEKMTSAERATLMGLVHVDATNRGIRTTSLSERGGVMGVLNQGAHGYKEVLVTEEAKSPSEIRQFDWQPKTISKRNGTHRESSSSGRHRQHQRGA